MQKRFPLLVWAIALVAICLVAAPAFGQFGQSFGNLYGKVVDEQGGALPGVSVTLTGPGAPQVQTTDAKGEFRYLRLSPGTYSVSLALAGFATLTHEGIVVNLGKNTDITEPMKLSAVAAAITVSGQAPLLDTRRVETGAVITYTELNSIPTGRDPWVILQSVPGVSLDRVNIAGSESAQQSLFVSKGSTMGSFTVDGVNFTDMSALGASAGYYDFGSFQEIQVITGGGSDPAIQGGGAHINMITKRGTNEVHGSGRINYVSDAFESTNTPGPTLGTRSIQSVQEYGADVGGPILKDTLWLWGAYGRDQINLLVGNKTPPTKSNSTLENVNGKLNWQIIPSNAFTLWGQHADKIVFGRGAGAVRPQAATNDQTLPTNYWKFEDSQVVSSNLFVSAMYAGQNGFFGLTPEGKGQLFYDGYTGYAGTSPYFLKSNRPTREVKANISYFFNTGSLGHELKAGFNYLQAGETANTGSPSNVQANASVLTKVGGFINTYSVALGDTAYVGGVSSVCTDPLGCPTDAGAIFRDRNVGVNNKYYSGFFGDTITMDRFTVAVGVRYDTQSGVNLASTATANPSYPTILPDLVYPGHSAEITWNNWSPRASLTYALGTNRNTILKASYAKFADSLGTATVTLTNPIGSSAGAYYPWNDINANGLVNTGEVVTTAPLVNNFGYNLANPADPGQPSNAIDPNLKAGTTNEFLVGVDHELTPGFAVGASYTYRKYTNPIVGLPYDAGTGIIVRNTDYVQYATLTGTTPQGVSYSVPVYDINPAVQATLTGGEYPGGFFYTNQGNYNQSYSGFDVTLTKRLSNKWMARANFSYGINKQEVGVNGCPGDPNNGPTASAYGFFGTTCRDGDYVALQSAGSGNHNAVYLNAKYIYNLNAMYQLPLNFNLAMSFFGRQGYPSNWYRNTVGTDDGHNRSIVVTPINEQRYPGLYELDLRLEKVIPFASTAAVTVAADMFNATNNDTTLQLQNRLNLGGSNPTGTIREVQNPRVYRFSIFVNF